MKNCIFEVEVRDKRENYLISALKEDGYNCRQLNGAPGVAESGKTVYAFSITRTVNSGDLQSLPPESVVFTRGADAEAVQIMREKNIAHFDYMDDEDFVFKNAYLTAECALSHLIVNTDCALRDMKTLIIGNGRIGKSLICVLSAVGAQLSAVCFCKQEQAYARAFGTKAFSVNEIESIIGGYSAVINTVPKIIIKGDILRRVHKNCFILDLASVPGGVDFNAAKQAGLNCLHALGVPGKLAPQTAGRYLKDSILKRLNTLYDG